MPKPGVRRRRSLEEVRGLVEELRQSGLSMAAFAAHAGVHPNTVSNWVRREAEEAETRCAVPVRLKVPLSGADRAIEIVLRNGLTVRVHEGFDRGALLELLASLDPSC